MVQGQMNVAEKFEMHQQVDILKGKFDGIVNEYNKVNTSLKDLAKEIDTLLDTMRNYTKRY